jgi:hypothetical protein
MAEQTKRQQLESHLAARAAGDPDFRDRLLGDPKTVIETEIGLRFPDRLAVTVHEERLHQLHIVLQVDLQIRPDVVDGIVESDAGAAPFWKRR